MNKYMCMICGWVYDPDEGDLEGGVPSGVSFTSVPDTWECPDCGVSKGYFQPLPEIDLMP